MELRNNNSKVPTINGFIPIDFIDMGNNAIIY
jgi:hypothetical protein